MIKAIRDLGFFELKEVSEKEVFDIEEFEKIRHEDSELVAKMIAEKATAKTGVKVYVLKIKDGKLDYEIDESIYKEQECSEDNYREYLFKEPRSSKGAYISPTFKLSPPSSEEKTSTSASRLKEYLNTTPLDLKDFKKYTTKEIDAIFQKIRDENKGNKTSILITIKPNGKYLASFPDVSKKFIDGFIEETKYLDQNAPKNYNPENQKGQCSICLRDNLSLLGYLRPYNFFTVDKIGFYPSFKNYESWKYFPVCESCGILIQGGKNFLENYFKARIAGYNVLVILKNKELIEKQKKSVDFNTIKSFKQIANIEKFLIKKLPELTTVESYNFMFYKENQNQFEILSLIPDILPSRIKKIVDSIKEIKERFEDSNWFDLDKVQKKKGDWRIDSDFYFMEEGIGERTDFPKIDYSPTKVKMLNLIQSAFTGQLISYSGIISEISSKLQFVFKQSLNFDKVPVFKLAPYVFSGAATIEFLKEVGVMETGIAKVESDVEYPERLKEVFEKHKVFFDTPQKRAGFLVGVLYGKLEALQASPLINKKGTSLGWLRSLDLRWDHLIKELFPRIHLKFKEYDNATPILGKEVKKVFELASSEIEGCGDSGLGREEIPFYFTLGWTSYKSFLPPKNKEEDVDENNKEERK